MTKTRTDAHSPAHLVTENYQYVGSYDASPTAGMIVEFGQFGEKSVSYGPEKARAEKFEAMIAESTESRRDGRCDHCGATIRYRAVMRHRPTGQVIQVGETCLENRFSVATADFKRMKKAAEEARAEQRVKKAVEAFVEAHPDLAWMASEAGVEATAPKNWFVADVARKLRAYGELSERQIEAVKKSVAKDAEMNAKRQVWAAERAAQDAARPHAAAPSGRVTVEGVVLSVREPDESAMYPSWKMLVLDDKGFKTWGNIPSRLWPVSRGTRVRFSAEITPSDKDPEFSFFSRPTKAEILAQDAAVPSGK